jgi:P-type Ca2+ transporter type 2C
MSQARHKAPGRGYERKRPNPLLPIKPHSTAASSASSFSRTPYAGPGYYQLPVRSESPPASTYFPDLSEDPDGEPLPTADADSHFAYSTTLRRHHRERSMSMEAEVQSLWQKFLRHVSGQDQYERLESGPADVSSVGPEERKDTLNARFAHCTVEVCAHLQSFCS